MEFWDKFPIIPTVIEVNKYFAGPKMGTNRKASEMAFLKKLEWWEIVRWKCWWWGKWKILDSIQVIIKANIKNVKIRLEKLSTKRIIQHGLNAFTTHFGLLWIHSSRLKPGWKIFFRWRKSCSVEIYCLHVPKCEKLSELVLKTHKKCSKWKTKYETLWPVNCKQINFKKVF